MEKILLVEDEARIRNIVLDYFTRLIFLIPSLSVRQHFIGYADLIHDSRRICYPAKAGTKAVQPVPPRSAASFSSERVNK